MLKTYRLLGGYPSTSASPTDIWEMRRADGKICVAKIYLQSIGGIKRDSSAFLDHEGYIYSKIGERTLDINSAFFVKLSNFLTNLSTDDLLSYLPDMGIDIDLARRNFVQNVHFMIVGKRGYGGPREAINDDSGSVSAKKKKEIDEYIEDMKKNNVRFGAIITEKETSMTLEKYFGEKKSMEEKMSLISVLFYSIICLSKMGFNQNDMHWNNVLVRKRAVEVPYYIIFGLLCHRVTNPDIPVLFDFDRGVEQGKYFPPLEVYKSGGSCPSFHPARDILKAICILTKDYHMEEIMLNFILDRAFRGQVVTAANCWLEKGDNSLFCKDTLNSVKYVEAAGWILGHTNTWFRSGLLTPTHSWMQELKYIINKNNPAATVDVKRKLFEHRFKYDSKSDEIKKSLENVAKVLFP